METGYERCVLTRVGQRANSHDVEILYLMSLYCDQAAGKEAEGVWEQGVEENIWA